VTIESDFELNFALPANRRGTTTRLVITEPSATSSPQAARERVPPVRPAPFDLTPIQNILRSFGGACSVQNQPQPFISMAMRGFAQPQQQANQPSFYISSIFNLISGLNPVVQPPSTPAPAQPETPKSPPVFSCPFDFFQGLIESTLEENEEWQEIAEKYVRHFIKEQVKAAGNVLPQLEELASMAVEAIISFITDPDVQAQCPWIKLFAPEQVRGILDSVLASPVVQEIVYSAYTAVSEAVEKKAASTPAPVAEPALIPVPVPRVPEPTLVVAPTPAPVIPAEPETTEEEKECLAQLATMGFIDKQLNLRLLRQANFDLWETIQLLL